MAHHDSSEEITERGRTGRAFLGAALGLAFALSAILFRSPLKAGLFAASLAVFVAPGIPLARLWFSGFEAVLAGCALGFFLSSLAGCLLVGLEHLTPLTLLLASGALFVVAWWFSRSFSGAPARDPSPGHGIWLAFALSLPIVLVAAPFVKVGAFVGDGYAYRAYFSADLMTHLSVVSEIQKGSYPLENPFFAGERLSYYWLFFVFPAALGASTSNQAALLSLYLASGILFAGLLFVAVRALGLPPSRSFLVTAVSILAVSYEGVLALGRTAFGFEPWTQTNVDAFSRWVLGLVSLDGLQRSILYTPQHLFSYSLLVLLIVLLARGELRDRKTAVLAGALLGGMAGTSIVTAMLAGPWLLLVIGLRSGSLRRFVELSIWTAAPALALLAWYVVLGFFGDAGGAIAFRRPRALELPAVLLLESGALVLLLLLRIRTVRLERRDFELAGLSAVSLAAVLFLDVQGYEGVWMAWRAGSVLLVTLALLAAPALGGRLRLAHAFVLLPALATAALDVFNAQDVTNRSLSPGEFRWTTVVSGDEWEALEWIRKTTPAAAVVQWDVRARELGEWALLPAIAERRMAVGSPIFLLDLGKYRVRERRHVRPIFGMASAEEAHRLARRMKIDYLLIGARELQVRREGIRKLFESKVFFRPVFTKGSVTVLEVLPG
jgi:hypothetical protein